MPLTKNHQAQHQRQFSGGFGLVELMVSIGIITLVTSIVIVRNDAYNASILLKSEAFEVALQIRETQMQAVSALGQGGGFRGAYGLAFTRNSANYSIFKDTDNDYWLDSGEQVGQRINVSGKFMVSDIRTVVGANETSVSSLAVVFERPNFDAKFYQSSGTAVSSSVERVEIDIRRVGTSGPGNGKVRTVEVLRTGQVSVQ